MIDLKISLKSKLNFFFIKIKFKIFENLNFQSNLLNRKPNQIKLLKKFKNLIDML